MIAKYLHNINPYTGEEALRFISSRRVADANVNTDQTECIGKQILGNMTCKTVLDVTLKKKDTAIIMAVKSISSK